MEEKRISAEDEAMNNLVKDGKILNVPLFLIEYVDKLI